MRLILLVALLLAGCASTSPVPEPIVRTVTVDRLVPVPCVDAADLPAAPPPLGPPPATTDDALREATARALLLRGLYDRIQPALIACSGK